jgi:hypothetical protein
MVHAALREKMMAFLTAPTPSYRNKAVGTCGTFQTPAGRVNFLMTKAKLGQQDLTPAARLMRLVIPAREALNIKEMDFSQLLQRDLDDHRIATDLVPYVLRPELNGPAFFPPIMTVLLPFDGRKPIDEFPSPRNELINDPEYPANQFNAQIFGEFFRFQSLMDAEHRDDPAGMGILRWNDERAKLVIVDGQHRAMALLAVDRTVNGTWSETAGERYKPFYEERIRELIKPAADGSQIDLAALEFPVTICWFPEYAGPGQNPHKAARKLFVDVNQNAKKPSESRLILLSDTELDNMFARDLLSRVRDQNSNVALPLYAIEYDNPEQTTTPTRWSVVTNLEILRAMVQRCVFGPPEPIENVGQLISAPRGKPNEARMGSHMRQQLDLLNFMPASIEDGPREIERDDITRKHFPIYNHVEQKLLIERFYNKWGKGFLLLLSELLPYRTHIQALKGLQNGWTTGGSSTGELAKEALFEGVGMYWTLQDGHQLWVEQSRAARLASKLLPTQPEVSKAWQLIADNKRDEFSKERARLYLDGNDAETVNTSEQVFIALNTFAAQLGLAMTWATIRHMHPTVDGNDIANCMISNINAALEDGPVANRDRRAIFAKDLPDQKKAFNKLPKMDTPFATYFRYFWLQLLLVPRNHDELKASRLDVDSLQTKLRTARLRYLTFLADNSANALKQSNPELGEEERMTAAQTITAKSMGKAFTYWFGGTQRTIQGELLSDLKEGSSAWLPQEEQEQTQFLVIEPLNGSEEIVAELAVAEGSTMGLDEKDEDEAQ